jgi:hypothetical protein
MFLSFIPLFLPGDLSLHLFWYTLQPYGLSVKNTVRIQPMDIDDFLWLTPRLGMVIAGVGRVVRRRDLKSLE